jgi:DNA-binding NarL/FixJ family response regulator
MKRPRVLLADDHILFLQGISKLLEAEIEVVGTVQDGRALLAAVEQHKPDVVLLDIAMPLLNGLDAARQLKKAYPSVRIVFLTMHMNAAYVTEAFRAGAVGYLLKGCEASEVLTAIREVLKGRSYVTPLVTKETLDSLLHSAGKNAGSLPSTRLTARQREVLQLLAEGRTTKEVAQLLDISVRTVEFHKSRLMEELGLHSRAALVKYAIASGITDV